MTEHHDNPVAHAPNHHAWPLNGVVRMQLALACIWGPYALGLLLVLAVSTAHFVIDDETLLATQAAHRLLASELTYWCGVVLGAFAAPIALPMLWPAAARIHTLRRLAAGIVGPAAVRAGAIVVKHIALTASPQFGLFVEPLVMVLGTGLGTALVWPILRAGE